MKECKQCNKTKSKDGFYKNPSCSDGLNPICKECSYHDIDKKECYECGEEYQPRANSQKYCSVRCRKLSNKTQKQCKQCNNLFYPAMDGARYKYCSKKCYRISNGRSVGTKDCVSCGKAFDPAEKNRSKYCSEQCASYSAVKKKEKQCLYCGNTFMGKDVKQYCNERCRNKARYERRERRTYTITCQHCGQQAEVTQKDGKYCSTECFYEDTDYSHIANATHGFNCLTCGDEFETGCATAKYCSDECNPSNWNSTNIWFLNCSHCEDPFTSTRPYTKYCGKECKYKERRERKVERLLETDHYQKKCKNCGDSFCSYRSEHRDYCSPDCAKENTRKSRRQRESHYARARKYGVEKENIDRLSVFEDDNYVCQHCGIETDDKLVGKNTNKENEPTLDHIIPMSKGGDHTYDNVQTLCRSCNIKKGDKILTKSPA